jgi:hypothetical protein
VYFTPHDLTSSRMSRCPWGRSGWTILNNLYLLNGTWYIVTDNPSDFPLIRLMTSTGAEIWNDEQSIHDRWVLSI